MTRRVLIDGDVLVYRFACAEQTVVKWDDSLHTTFAKLEPAKVKLADFIDWVVGLTDADACTLVLSDWNEGFRKTVYPEYKGNRKGKDRPLLYRSLREHLLEDYEAVMWPDLEGDDVLGIMQTEPSDEERIIATIDKDLLTIPGLLVNWDKVEEGERAVTPKEAELAFYTQVLTGDPVDGYPGCPGIGPVKAKRLLDAAETDDVWREVIVPAYEKAKLSEAVALVQARCAYILRHGDYDGGGVRLWEPPPAA